MCDRGSESSDFIPLMNPCIELRINIPLDLLLKSLHPIKPT